MDKVKAYKRYSNNYQKKIRWGLKHGYILPYDDKLIEELREITYGGIPASILLLCDGMSNGFCYDRAMLLAKAFLNKDDDINLIYASILSLRKLPSYKEPMDADHCFMERINKDGHHIIYDTSGGFMYDKDFYWWLEKPAIRHIQNKDAIRAYHEYDEERWPEDIEESKYWSILTLPNIERVYGRPNEMYAQLGFNLLEEEIKLYKERIKYDDVVQEVEEDMIRLGLKKRSTN